MRVVLDPGHGGDAARGASTPIGTRGPRGSLEKDLTLDVARRARDRLSGEAVVLTRDDDRNVSLGDRGGTSTRAGADVFVSLHFNGSERADEQGVEVWVHDEGSSASRQLATRLAEAITAVTGHRNRGVIAAPLAVLEPSLHRARAASCLVELGFLTDPREEERLEDAGYRDRIAEAVAHAIRAERWRFAERPKHAFDVWHEVPLVEQLTGMSCWAAAAAMIVGWRECVSVTSTDVARGVGGWEAYRDGLLPDDVESLARVFSLTIEEPRRYTVAALRVLLETCGPLWVGEASPGLHVVVVSGLHGDGSPEGTFVRVVDPWPIGRGERYSLRFSELVANLDAAASVVGVAAQILHTGGARRAARARRDQV